MGKNNKGKPQISYQNPKNDREIKQIFSNFRRKNRKNTEMEVAPIRTLDDFILTKSRFQIPNFQDEDRWFNRIIYNLMYYQTNYLISSAVIFGFVLFARPQEMLMGIFLMALVFGSIHLLQSRQLGVRDFKKNHPLVVTFLCFSVGYYLIYKLTSVAVFIFGILLPILFMILHASLRMRNVMNKFTNVSNVLGFTKQTPMGLILEGVGIEPNLVQKMK